MAEAVQVSHEQLEMHQDQETQGETQESTGNRDFSSSKKKVIIIIVVNSALPSNCTIFHGSSHNSSQSHS
jgi:hypothetical protein